MTDLMPRCLGFGSRASEKKKGGGGVGEGAREGDAERRKGGREQGGRRKRGRETRKE